MSKEKCVSTRDYLNVPGQETVTLIKFPHKDEWLMVERMLEESVNNAKKINKNMTELIICNDMEKVRLVSRASENQKE